MRLLIKNGRIVDPGTGRDAHADILVCDRIIEKVGRNLRARPDRVIDVSGLVVTPGFIDMHVHLREPGYEEKETIRTGSMSGARGGFTSVLPMANTNPPIDTAGMVEFVLTRAKETAVVKVFPVAAVSKGLAGKELTEAGELKEAGAIALSDDGNPIEDSELMRRALEYAGMFGLPIIVHAEDPDLAGNGCMNEGLNSTRLGLRGIPRAAEEVMVARDLSIAELTKGRVHFAHISTTRSVDLIRQAKERGLAVTAETAPHYFSLTDDAVKTYNTNAKMKPPLREADDVAAIKEGLKDRTLDVIATDHAPHTVAEKEVEFEQAPFGIVGLETALPLVLTYLVEPGVLSLSEAIAKLTVNPARILGLPLGELREGWAADITIFDPDAEVVVDASKFASLGRNTPFDGFTLKGRVMYTIVDGTVVVDEGELAVSQQ
jgi:dihydroorotase